MSILIRPASSSDAEILTEISFESKRFWGYPDDYFNIWKDELTITPQYIEKNKVFIAEDNYDIAGFASVANLKQDLCFKNFVVKEGSWLDHIFIRPKHIKKGIGTKLMESVFEYCRNNNIKKLSVFSDPYAKGFYQKHGARYIGESPSSIDGRTVPIFEMDIE